MKNKTLVWGVVIIILVIIGLVYFTSNRSVTNAPVTSLNAEVQRDLKYLPNWTAQVADHYGVDGKIDYSGYVLVPPAPHSDVIAVGEHGISLCSDVPDATRCFGGGKGADFAVTFTRSNDPFVLDAFYNLQVKLLSSLQRANPDMAAGRGAFPIITSIFPASGPSETIIGIEGKDFFEFNAGERVVIENSKGELGYLSRVGSVNTTATSQTFKVIIGDKACKTNSVAPGNECTSFMQLTPGVYSIYAMPYDKEPVKFKFTITSNSNPNMGGGDLGFSIKVLSPKTGDVYKIGSKMTIKWNDPKGMDADNYTIALINRNNSVSTLIASNVLVRSSGIDGTSAYEWTVPLLNTKAMYNIEVYRATARELFGRSQAFSITN